MALRFSVLRLASYLGRKKDLYQILEVESSATHDEIKRAFVRLTARLHPDTRGVDKESERLQWSNRSLTEQFMEVKEAYDILRKPEKRKEYDEERRLAQGLDGHLVEATSARFEKNTVINLQRDRNEMYTGPGKKRDDSASGHFRNPEEEYEKERQKNRSLYLIGALFLSIVLTNIGYVHYLRSSDNRKVL
ncbi:dnj-3 [Pristionchus pacificus]|uniref:DnaJ homolog subfamily B member 9 n=1 Tax=Pristionchus pacificus TaxID=54126 RepID=A0A2A6B4J8_PRIPA|nr:dnj-3 [Pristionchus pacificus]|eukprot:PDM60794.1 dnj-3 [Pristionchus pacificus]